MPFQSRRRQTDADIKMTKARPSFSRRCLGVVACGLALLPALPSPIAGHAATPSPAFVQGAATAASARLALPKAVTGGDLLVAGLTTNDNGTDAITGVSDSLNGSWTRLSSVRYGNGHVDVYYFNNSAAGADTVAMAGGQAALTVAEYSGLLGPGSPVDQSAGKGSAGNPAAGPTAAIGAANELVLGIAGMSAPGAFSAGSGFTLRESAVSNYLYSNGLEDSLTTSTAGQSMVMKSANTGYYGAIVAVFKAILPASGPTAALTLSSNAGAVPLVVTADASGSTQGANPISGFTFNFGDGSAVVGPQASARAAHSYGSGGRYTVTVTVTDGAGATSNATAAVTAGAPAAALQVTPSSGPAPLAVTADASGSSDPIGITTYTFNFGDGSAAVGPQASSKASHTFAAGGSYTVSVQVGDSVGASSTTTATAQAWSPPGASIIVSPPSGASPLAVHADASGSTTGTNPIASYTFNFGDGSAAVGPQPGATANHTYSVGGTFTPTVTVTDTAGASSAGTATVKVGAPSAALKVNPASGLPPLAVIADASASSDPIGITGYTFDFGDASAVVGPQAASSASHTYSSAGGYTARVTITDSVGATATTTAAVQAWTPPAAAISVSPSSGAAPLAVTADASGSTAGSNSIATYTFNFGDGSAVVGPRASATANHGYAAGGKFTLTVTVTDSGGAAAIATATITVGAPAASLKVSPASGMPPLAVIADASASIDPIGITSYTFDFGDGSAVVGPQPGSAAPHTYTSTGSYTANVTVTDSVGATSASTSLVTVTQAAPPTASLAVTPTSGGAPLSVTADASGSTSGSNPITGYRFNFGDGTTAGPTGTPVVGHVFSSPGTYMLTATVTDSAGASASASATVTVVAPPVAALSVTPTSGSAPLFVTADASGSRDPIGIAGYTFDFGDGSAAIGPQTGATAMHTYNSGGTFKVTVTARDTAGATATASTSVNVVVPPTATLSATPASGVAPLQVSASGANSVAGSRPIGSYTFNFGNGIVVGPQAAATANTTYASPGTYTVTLTVTDTGGTSATAATSITVSPLNIVQDTFQRANQNGWGTASNGATWSAGSGLSVAANEGRISYTGLDQWETLGAATAADGNGLVRFSIGSATDPAGIMLRWANASNRWLGRYDGAGNVQITVRSGGTENNLGRAPVTVATGKGYWLRFVLQGQTASIRLWPDGTVEPSTWNLSANSALVPGAALMGLYAWAASGGPVQFDNYSVAGISSPVQVANSTITGSVTDSATSAAISGVQVSTVPPTSTTTTNGAGAYSLPVPSGTYSVVFTGASSGYNANYLSGVQAPANGSVTAVQRLVPIPSQVAMDTFTQPDQTGGWSPGTDGHTWGSDLGSYPGARAGITSSQAWVDTSSSTATDYDNWMGYQYQNQEVTADLNMTTVLSDPTFQHGGRLMARVQNSTTWIQMTLDPPNGSNPANPNGDLTISVVVNNSWTQVAIVPQALSTNTWYHAKLDVVGSMVVGKVWAFGSAEPGWLISANQTTLPGAGQAGTRTTGAYVNWASFMQKPITQISGVITDAATGSAIAQATVALNTGATTTADANGLYTFAGLIGGTAYTVTASAAGYIAGSVTVTPIVGTTAGGSFGLSPTPSSGAGTGGLTISTQIQNGIINNPNNGQTETDLTWTDAAGNGWRVGTIPGYGGANISTWYEVDGGVVGPTQSNLNTTNPTDLFHDFTQSPSGAYWGSESTPYAQASLGPIAPAFRVGYQATVPASGVDPNGFTHTVTTYVYPGDPGFLVNRFDITNPSASPIQLSPTQSIEYDVISGLNTATATWRLGNGGYGNVGSAPVQGWPTSPAPGNPDYFYVVPAAGSGVSDGILAVPATKLASLGLLNVQVLGEADSHRMKVVVYGNNGVFPSATTESFYVLQAISRNLTAGEAQSVAADYLNPDSPAMSVGASNGFSYNEGLYSFTASSNLVTFTPGFSSTVQERWLDIYKVTNYSASNLPGVTLNGAALAPGVEYVSYVDQVNHVAYVKLLKPLVPGAPAAGQLRAGPITIG
jgi:PKD repeat protein